MRHSFIFFTLWIRPFRQSERYAIELSSSSLKMAKLILLFVQNYLKVMTFKSARMHSGGDGIKLSSLRHDCKAVGRPLGRLLDKSWHLHLRRIRLEVQKAKFRIRKIRFLWIFFGFLWFSKSLYSEEKSKMPHCFKLVLWAP